MLRLEVREVSVRIVKHLEFILNVMGSHWRVSSRAITFIRFIFKRDHSGLFGEKIFSRKYKKEVFRRLLM